MDGKATSEVLWCTLIDLSTVLHTRRTPGALFAVSLYHYSLCIRVGNVRTLATTVPILYTAPTDKQINVDKFLNGMKIKCLFIRFRGSTAPTNKKTSHRNESAHFHCITPNELSILLENEQSNDIFIITSKIESRKSFHSTNIFYGKIQNQIYAERLLSRWCARKRKTFQIDYRISKIPTKKKTKNLLKIVTLSVMIKDESVVKFQIN